MEPNREQSDSTNAYDSWTPLTKCIEERNKSDSVAPTPTESISSQDPRGFVTPVQAHVDQKGNKKSQAPRPPKKSAKKKDYISSAAAKELAIREKHGVYAYRVNPYCKKYIPEYYEEFPQSRGFSDMDYPPVGTSWTLRFATDILIFSKIGEGTFATVHQAVNRVEGCFYAVKKVPCDPSGDRQRNRQALTEVQVSASLGVHDNIVRYFTSFYENEYLYIQYELCDRNLKAVSLDNKKFTSQKALLNMIYQIAVALEFIHKRGIIHMAVSPLKIYIAYPNFKLGGFRYAVRKDKPSDIKTKGLYVMYTAPEILAENVDYKELDPELLETVDIYSLGATVYELTRGFSANHLYSHSFEQLVSAMMNPLPSSRPTAKALLGTLREEFQIYSATPISSLEFEDEDER